MQRDPSEPCTTTLTSSTSQLFDADISLQCWIQLLRLNGAHGRKCAFGAMMSDSIGIRLQLINLRLLGGSAPQTPRRARTGELESVPPVKKARPSH